MTKEILTKTIQDLEADRQRRIDSVKQKVQTEQIVPYYREVDAALGEALAELNSQYLAETAALKQRFDLQKNELSNKAQKKKSDYAEAALAAATAEINADVDRAVTHIRQFMGEG